MHRATQFCILLTLCTPVTLAAPQEKATRVLVLKKEHKMELFSGEKIIKTYTVALGRGGVAQKERQGDHLTPEGLYRIDHRNANSRFYRALHVSYPNEADRERARKLGMDPGGDIMIYGIRNGLGWLGSLQRTIDWTSGCIAVTDAEMDETWSLVPDGTRLKYVPETMSLSAPGKRASGDGPITREKPTYRYHLPYSTRQS